MDIMFNPWVLLLNSYKKLKLQLMHSFLATVLTNYYTTQGRPEMEQAQILLDRNAIVVSMWTHHGKEIVNLFVCLFVIYYV